MSTPSQSVIEHSRSLRDSLARAEFARSLRETDSAIDAVRGLAVDQARLNASSSEPRNSAALAALFNTKTALFGSLLLAGIAGLRLLSVRNSSRDRKTLSIAIGAAVLASAGFVGRATGEEAMVDASGSKPSPTPEPEDTSLSGQFWWQDRICTVPQRASVEIQGATAEEQFVEQLMEDSQEPLTFSLEQHPAWRGNASSTQIVLMARYPSGAIRSLASDPVIRGRSVDFVVSDRSVFLDPRVPSLPLDGQPVSLEVTLFAIDCPETVE